MLFRSDTDSEEEADGDGNAIEASRQARIEAREERLATNGNQETLMQDDVRALDNVAPYMQNIGPNETVDVTAPQIVNGEDAGYVPYYNDGASTGFVPQQSENKTPWPADPTNPAFAPYARSAKKSKKSDKKADKKMKAKEKEKDEAEIGRAHV